MWSNLQPGAKFVIILLIVGGIAFGIYKVVGSSKSSTTTTEQKSSSGGILSKVTNVFSSGPDITVVVNTWGGFAPLVDLNDGLEPNENSRMYKEFGLKVKILVIDAFEESRNTYKTGKADVIYCTADALPIDMGLKSAMTELKSKFFVQVDWSRGGDLIVARKGINKVSDFIGKTISVAEGTASHTLLLKILEANGISESQVTIKKVKDGIESANLFKAGAVDVSVIWTPDDGDCLKAIPGSKIVIDSRSASFIIADGFIAREDFINKNGDKLVKFGTAWLTENGDINTDPTVKLRAAYKFAKAFGVDTAFAINGMSKVRFVTFEDNKNFFGLNTAYTGVTGEQLYTKMSNTYSELKLTENPLPWRNVSVTSIIESIQLSGMAQAAEAPVKFTPVTKEIASKEAISNKKVTINFETNSYTLSDDAKATIDREFLSTAKQFRDARVKIEGNTDATGNFDSNVVLSKQRAQSVANYLVTEYKMDPNKFIIVGNGPKKAIADGVKGDNANYRRTDFGLVIE
jgi:NitT/TauT family transport system substrate-binding protein